jgi:hypothetical protein
MDWPMHRMHSGLSSVLVAFALVATMACGRAVAAEPPNAVHGSADLYAGPGVTLAWGILRGATETSTLVAVRIIVARDVYGAASIVGIDPFTQKEQVLLPPGATTGRIDARISRAQFAELPRTEFRLFASPPKAPGDVPKLVVYYLGIPDTTPEFTSESALESYLAARVSQGSKKP